MSPRVFAALVLSLCGCGVTARVGAGVSGTTRTVAPEAVATVGLTAGSSTFHLIAGLTGALGVGVTPQPVVPVGRLAGVLEANYAFARPDGNLSPWGLRGGLGVGPNFDGARGVGWLVFARVGPTFAVIDSSDFLTSLGLELMVGVTGFPNAELFWGVSFNLGWVIRVMERLPMGG